jgi:poly-gamma-glutamate synthesis protein (capsule biosynthesis protein)
VVAPFDTLARDLPRSALDKMWRGKTRRKFVVSTETERLLNEAWGEHGRSVVTSDAHPKDLRLGYRRWSLMPTHAVPQQYKQMTLGGLFPLHEAAADSVLSVPLCLELTDAARERLDGETLPVVQNIDQDAISLVIMTGVTALTRYTAELMEDKGITYPARSIKKWFTDADYVHVSNEVSFNPECEVTNYPTQKFCSNDRYIELLEELNVNLVELTGSHLSDYGREWINHSIDMYEERGWHWFGGGRDQDDARKAVLIEHNGNKLAFLGCNAQRTNNTWVRPGPDVASCDWTRMQWQIRDLREKGYEPILSIQHSEVYRYMPGERLVRDLRRLAKAGASVVIGSQAHVPHPYEFHHDAFVHYGPGNFLFDQVYDATQMGAIDRLYFHKGKLLTVEIRPITIADLGRPRPMSRGEYRTYVKIMNREQRRMKPKAKPWAAPVDDPTESRQVPDSYLTKKGQQRKYWLHTPAAADKSDDKWPLIIFLHGSGARGSNLDRVLKRGLPKRLVDEPEFPFMVASPQAKRYERWKPWHVTTLLDHLLAKYPNIDPDRVYLTGLSMGGQGAWHAAGKFPDRFAAVAPIAAAGKHSDGCRMKNLPVWAFHGDKDRNVRLVNTTSMVKAIEKCGGTRVKTTIYEGGGHSDSWKNAYADPALYEWFLEHRRSTN